MSKLRVVKPDEPDESKPSCFADAARAALEAILAKGAFVVVILYESEASISYEPVPPSLSLARGLINDAHDMIEARGE